MAFCFPDFFCVYANITSSPLAILQSEAAWPMTSTWQRFNKLGFFKTAHIVFCLSVAGSGEAKQPF